MNLTLCSYTDAYDIFAVNFANTMVGYVYFPATGALPSSSDTAIKIATSAGTVVGQLGFGFLADHLGRKKVFFKTSKILTCLDVRY
jgi:MFS transporter, PHS family, inorganic phosphate transporter